MRVLTGKEARESSLALSVGDALLLRIQSNPLKLLSRTPQAGAILAQNGRGRIYSCGHPHSRRMYHGATEGEGRAPRQVGQADCAPSGNRKGGAESLCHKSKKAARARGPKEKRRSETGATDHRLSFDNWVEQPRPL